jgi:chaperonin GroES
VQGEVVAVGPGRLQDDGRRSAPDVEVGERVLFGKYAGTEVKLGGEKLLVLREEDVMGVIDA